MRAAICIALGDPPIENVRQLLPDSGPDAPMSYGAHLFAMGRLEVDPGQTRTNLEYDPDVIALHNRAVGLFPRDVASQSAYRIAGFQAIAFSRAVALISARYFVFAAAPIPARFATAAVEDLRARNAVYRSNAAFAPQGLAEIIVIDAEDAGMRIATALVRHLYLSGHAGRRGDFAFREMYDLAVRTIAALDGPERRQLATFLSASSAAVETTTAVADPAVSASTDFGGRRLFVLSDDVAATQAISFARPASTIAARDDALVTLADGKAGTAAVERALASSGATHLVLSRYSGSDGASIATSARERGMPVIYHLDDDLLAVPESLGAAKFASYNAPERLQALRATIQSADIVYASTRPLAERLALHGIDRPIIAGDVYCTVDTGLIAPRIERETPILGFMGTGGHQQDLAAIVPAIAALLVARPTLRFETFGSVRLPAELVRFGDRVSARPGIADYSAFLGAMSGLGWWIGVAPLEDNAFNRCKADTKWVEYSFAGIATVAADIGVYEQAAAGDCARLVRSPAEWETAIGLLLDDAAMREALVARARARLVARYGHAALLAQINDMLDRADREGLERAAAAEAFA